MEELIARISASASVEPEVAQKAVGLILGFLRKEGPRAEIDALFAMAPGAAEAAARVEANAADDDADAPATGSFGAMGGGLMGLAGKLTGLGLGMGQMQMIGREVFAYAREKAGDERIGQVVATIPGLSQFL
jgi:predicted lipid-binding transport protein (Tim44 family)